ncbi:MAG: hypothetical protein D6778_03595, partial [Nitrospirae bacterium]
MIYGIISKIKQEEVLVPSTLEERVAYLEGKVEEHSKAWTDLKETMNNHDSRMIAFEQRIDRRFEAIERRIDF